LAASCTSRAHASIRLANLRICPNTSSNIHNEPQISLDSSRAHAVVAS
jgi:hypothetical protein